MNSFKNIWQAYPVRDRQLCGRSANIFGWSQPALFAFCSSESEKRAMCL